MTCERDVGRTLLRGNAGLGVFFSVALFTCPCPQIHSSPREHLGHFGQQYQSPDPLSIEDLDSITS